MDVNLWLNNNNKKKISFNEFLNNNEYKNDKKLYFKQVNEYKINKNNKEFINNMINWSHRFLNDEYTNFYNWINNANDENDPITLYAINNNLNISESDSIEINCNTTSSSLDSSDLSSDSSELLDNSED
jgi:hypothetical protein